MKHDNLIEGKWHSQGSAAQVDASLHVIDGEDYRIETDMGGRYSGALKELQVSDRLGNVERKIMLEDGSVFATRDNDAIDSAFKKHRKINGFIHALENNMGLIVVAVVVTMVTGFSFFKWGVPWASEKIAHALPQKTNDLIALDSLKYLDKFMFTKSKLDPKRQEQIRTHFREKLVPYGTKDVSYNLHFRNWSMLGVIDIPNAFALPSGDLIMTDKFVELAKNQDEIDSVLFHEMGHVERRHGLEMLIEGTFVTVAVMLVIGDVSWIADMGVGLGAALISSSYSRKHESEADLFAFKKMLKAGIDPIAFSNIMNRLESFGEEIEEKRKQAKGKKKVVVEKKGSSPNDMSDFMSSHPSTAKRVEMAKKYSACFKKGLATCDIVLP